MWWFKRKSLRRIRSLIEAIRAGEYNQHFATDRLGGEERRLVDELNAVVGDLRDRMARQEELYGSYRTMLNQVSAALLAVNAADKVVWMNERAINDLCGFAVDSVETLKCADPSLPGLLAKMQPGEQRLASLDMGGRPAQLKIAMVRYLYGGEPMRLFTIENVQQVVQQSESEAERKLISVLTHEIMNSLSPIISLSETLSQTMREGGGSLDEEALVAIEAISRRSRGLLTFVENYRKLSRLSPPQPSWVKTGDLVGGIRNLFADAEIGCEVDEPGLQLHIDRHQIEQVLINLLKNATEACAGMAAPRITLSAKADHANRRYLISVCDNGPGITPEAMESIFVPFFTTKQKGSGIGLSLSRQIVTNHGGVIKATSTGAGTLFSVQLPLVYKIEE